MGRLLPTMAQMLGLILLVGLFGLGLCLFSAGIGIWLATGLVMVYVLQVGQGGLFLASLWSTLLIALLVVFDYFPVEVLQHFPDFWPQAMHYRYWALILLILWAIAIGIFCLLGHFSDVWQQLSKRDRPFIQGIGVISILMGLTLGHQLGSLWLTSS